MWEVFQLSNVLVHAFDQRGVREILGQRVDDYLPEIFSIEGLGENLHGEDVVIAIDDESGQQVGFTENDAIGVSVARAVLTKANRGGDAMADEIWQISFG